MLICFGILCAPFELKKARMMSRYHVVKNLMVLHSFRLPQRDRRTDRNLISI